MRPRRNSFRATSFIFAVALANPVPGCTTDHVIIYPPSGPLGLTFKWEDGAPPVQTGVAVPAPAVTEGKEEEKQEETKTGEVAGGINRRGFIVQAKPDLGA